MITISSSDKVLVYINNQEHRIKATSSILQACEQVGVNIPRFCYHEKLEVAGNCRRCLVEVSKSPKPVASCAIPVSAGIVIFTDTPLVKKARESVIEILLVNHPLDCPICDQGGECDLQDQALVYGADRGRNRAEKRVPEDKYLGAVIKTVISRCIHCTRCIRGSAELADSTLGAFGRGEDTEIGSYIPKSINTEFSGNLVDLCPVGALLSKPYSFSHRP